MPRLKRRGHKQRDVEVPLPELSDEQLDAEHEKALQERKDGGSAWEYLKRSGDIINEQRHRAGGVYAKAS